MVPAWSDHLEMSCPIHWNAITKHTIIPTERKGWEKGNFLKHLRPPHSNSWGLVAWPAIARLHYGTGRVKHERWTMTVEIPSIWLFCHEVSRPEAKHLKMPVKGELILFFFLVFKWVVNACNLLQKHSCWGRLIRERTSQPRGTINTDPSTCSPEPTVGIISKPVPEHHKVQAGLEAKKGSNRITEDLASDALQAEKKRAGFKPGMAFGT